MLITRCLLYVEYVIKCSESFHAAYGAPQRFTLLVFSGRAYIFRCERWTFNLYGITICCMLSVQQEALRPSALLVLYHLLRTVSLRWCSWEDGQTCLWTLRLTCYAHLAFSLGMSYAKIDIATEYTIQ